MILSRAFRRGTAILISLVLTSFFVVMCTYYQGGDLAGDLSQMKPIVVLLAGIMSLPFLAGSVISFSNLFNKVTITNKGFWVNTLILIFGLYNVLFCMTAVFLAFNS